MKKEILAFMLLVAGVAQAQNDNGITLSGSVQSDMMIAPQQDEKIGTSEYDNDTFLTNTYVNLMMQSKYVDAGARFEFNQMPMPGYNDPQKGIKFKGWGVPNAWVKGKFKNVDVTLGSFYEQFGSGFILRSYEERSLGIDNSLTGAHVAWTPAKGVTVKALSGFQRNYWEWNKSLVSGADAEIALDEYIPALQKSNSHLSIGASWVNKRQDPDEGNITTTGTPIKDTFTDSDKTVNTTTTYSYNLNLPEFTNAFDARIRFQKNAFSMLAEYAMKTADPNTLNSYIYGKGHAELLSMSYAKSGLSAFIQAKRSENMGFRSDRSMTTTSPAGYINHLPAFTVDQTYSLAALYPYATQTEGEWAYQGSLAYKVKGRFAPKFKINYSLVTGLENARKNVANLSMLGTDGASSKFFYNGDIYYQDLDLMYEQKYNKQFELHLMYMYQQYNKTIVRGEGGNIYSHIAIADGKYKFNKKYTLRTELQYLYTEHESGDWAFGLVELSVAPYLMFTLSDQIGRPEPLAGQSEFGDITHYYSASVTANYKSHRLQVGYGRTRAGYNCTGGVCRYIPASKGITVSYNYNF